MEVAMRVVIADGEPLSRSIRVLLLAF